MYWTNYVLGDLAASGLRIDYGQDKQQVLRTIADTIISAPLSPWAEVLPGVPNATIGAYATSLPGGFEVEPSEDIHVTLYWKDDPELANGHACLLRLTWKAYPGYKLQVLDTKHASDRWLWYGDRDGVSEWVDYYALADTVVDYGTNAYPTRYWRANQRLIFTMSDRHLGATMQSLDVAYNSQFPDNYVGGAWHSSFYVWLPEWPEDGHVTREHLPGIAIVGGLAPGITTWNAYVGLPGVGIYPGRKEALDLQPAWGFQPRRTDRQGREMLVPLIASGDDVQGLSAYLGEVPNVLSKRSREPDATEVRLRIGSEITLPASRLGTASDQTYLVMPAYTRDALWRVA